MDKKLTMVVSGGLMFVGVWGENNRLLNPRIYMLINEGKEFQLSPMPCNPLFIVVHNKDITYPVPEHDKNLYELYEKLLRVKPKTEEEARPGFRDKFK